MDNADNWGIRFAEHMGGYFCEGVEDPQEGFERGKREGTAIDFWVKIHIMPLSKFFSDPAHAAAMEGRFSASGICGGHSLRNGAFNMYPGDPGSGFRHISYQFGFMSADNQRLFFSGVKNVHLDKREQTRREPVTLYSKLYRGDSEEGEVLGAGILLFDIFKDGTGLLFSLRVTGARSFSEKLRALRAFASASSSPA